MYYELLFGRQNFFLLFLSSFYEIHFFSFLSLEIVFFLFIFLFFTALTPFQFSRELCFGPYERNIGWSWL